ncbi:hypothetical protein BOW53_14270 [Solemya pervernicosa gill symbiont]|uniref:Uncharacterized protein n=2 Tax=Gammaproteobacteria incertae sedis TaxID=118884 RepID=A0A1T2L101_9GAMM|nr:ankyrin repeat domain-containing protein [Candidatus Reidiella endopervernicosa]OOZ38758.1 hypothetical protein BOW53_14270 [Solemya pervernicosa gill symbiont]QKQ26369.1 ankyrin repeat domain-containing protein [Candidatus Reidiella endopervernicosa]
MQGVLRTLLITLTTLVLSACGPSPYDEPPLHDAAMRGDANKVIALIKAGEPVDARNSEGATPLHWAAFKGHVDVAKLLVARGADVNALTKKGSTPLRLATTHEKTEMIRYLKSRGGTVR